MALLLLLPLLWPLLLWVWPVLSRRVADAVGGVPWQLTKPSAPRARLEMIRAAAVAAAAAGAAELQGLICSCGVRGLLLGGDEEEEGREPSSFIAHAVGAPGGANPGGASSGAGAVGAYPAPLVYFSCSRLSR